MASISFLSLFAFGKCILNLKKRFSPSTRLVSYFCFLLIIRFSKVPHIVLYIPLSAPSTFHPRSPTCSLCNPKFGLFMVLHMNRPYAIRPAMSVRKALRHRGRFLITRLLVRRVRYNIKIIVFFRKDTLHHCEMLLWVAGCCFYRYTVLV